MASRDKMKPNTTSTSRKIADPVPHSGMKTYLFRSLFSRALKQDRLFSQPVKPQCRAAVMRAKAKALGYPSCPFKTTTFSSPYQVAAQSRFRRCSAWRVGGYFRDEIRVERGKSSTRSLYTACSCFRGIGIGIGAGAAIVSGAEELFGGHWFRSGIRRLR